LSHTSDETDDEGKFSKIPEKAFPAENRSVGAPGMKEINK
jgi:hypothetical protein